MMKSKRGVSPVIATILLIAIVIVLGMIIFLWARGFIKESVMKKGEHATYACEKIKLEVEYFDTGELQVINTGNIPVYRIEVTGKSGGSINKIPTPEGTSLAATQSMILNVGDYNEVEVVPVILGEVETSKKLYTCKNSFVAKQS